MATYLEPSISEMVEASEPISPSMFFRNISAASPTSVSLQPAMIILLPFTVYPYSLYARVERNSPYSARSTLPTSISRMAEVSVPGFTQSSEIAGFSPRWDANISRISFALKTT